METSFLTPQRKDVSGRCVQKSGNNELKNIQNLQNKTFHCSSIRMEINNNIEIIVAQVYHKEDKGKFSPTSLTQCVDSEI